MAGAACRTGAVIVNAFSSSESYACATEPHHFTHPLNSHSTFANPSMAKSPVIVRNGLPVPSSTATALSFGARPGTP
jgi:hypothetical protein